MIGFGLLCGHLLGDYLFQEDWQARNKTNPAPPLLSSTARRLRHARGESDYHPIFHEELAAWESASRKWWLGHLACTIHCLLYTLAIALCSFWWMPWWGLLACFAVHWPIDRFRLARIWMERVSGQKAFATGPLAPWSVIVVDNTAHLLTLFVIALIAVGVPCA